MKHLLTFRRMALCGLLFCLAHSTLALTLGRAPGGDASPGAASVPALPVVSAAPPTTEPGMAAVTAPPVNPASDRRTPAASFSLATSLAQQRASRPADSRDSARVIRSAPAPVTN